MTAEELARIESMKGVKAHAEPKGRRIPSGELQAIMKGIRTDLSSGRRDAAIFALGYCGGLRRQELANLRLENINDLGEELEIAIKSGKGRKDRILFLNNGCKGCGSEALESARYAQELRFGHAGQRGGHFNRRGNAEHSSVCTTQRYDRRGDEAKKKAAKALHLPYARN